MIKSIKRNPLVRKGLAPYFDLKNRLRVGRNRKFLENWAQVESEAKPIFIIGPPRCGSTLFYQCMAHGFEVCYFTNEMMCRPFDVARYVARNGCVVRYESTFKSKHGRTQEEGHSAPHEGGPFWRRFFPRRIHDYIGDPDHLDNTEEEEIRGTLNFLSSYYGKPFLSKNMEMSLRLRSLRKVFPQALFVIVKRDPLAISSSLLGARLANFNDPGVWWSMRPINYEMLSKADLPSQLAGQILGVYRALYADMESGAFFEFFYEDFCLEPKRVFGELKDFLSANGIMLASTGRSIPERFEMKRGFLFSQEELDKLVAQFQNDEVFSRHLAFRMEAKRAS